MMDSVSSSFMNVCLVLGHEAHICRTDKDSIFDVLTMNARHHIFHFFDVVYSIGAALKLYL